LQEIFLVNQKKFTFGCTTNVEIELIIKFTTYKTMLLYFVYWF